MSDANILQEIRERKELADNAWLDIRKEAAVDMKFVGGDPWDDNDKKQRTDRPSVAPEEMGQYFNQVINGLMANPRGMKFSPVGNGANDEGAKFYQNKARETEYRSNAAIAYITAATNAIQRSYGYLRVNTRYAGPRSANQEIWIEAMPDPDLVLIDPDAKTPDSSDMQHAFVASWTSQSEHKRGKGKAGRIKNYGDFSTTAKGWVQGDKILESEYWTISTRPRTLVLAQPPTPEMPQGQRVIAPPYTPPPAPIQVFEDEIAGLQQQYRGRLQIVKALRKVDYPQVKQYLTNGIELLSDPTDWPGKYIPVVSCYGKVLYVPEGGETKKKILSMTRFGRDPWKAYCYACSQQLEVLGLVPKASLLVAEGQMSPKQINDVARAMHEPLAVLLYKAKLPDGTPTERPVPLEYPVGQHLQALEMVKEGFRRAIQAAMGSNFLPTQAQRRNEKSGKALDKMEQSAAQGTYHFVYSYEGMIRRTAEIFEDLVDKIHDYMGDVGVIEADGTALKVRINDPNDPKSVSTKGDYLVTVSSGPSTDSEREAVDDFTETMVQNLKIVAEVSGPHAAAQVLAHSIRMKTELGAMGEQLADIIDPPQPGKDGKPIPPEIKAMMGQLQQAGQKVQQLEQQLQGRTAEKQMELGAKKDIAQMEIDSKERIALAELDEKAKDREAKLAVAEETAKTERMDLFLEERKRIGARIDAIEERLHDRTQRSHDRVHDLNVAHIGHQMATAAAEQGHEHALEQSDAATEGALIQQQQAADLAPEQTAGAGA